jgi:hypothetical protein
LIPGIAEGGRSIAEGYGAASVFFLVSTAEKLSSARTSVLED